MLAWVMNLGFAASASNAPAPTPTPPQEQFSGGYLSAFEVARIRREERRRIEKRRRQDEDEIQVALDREVARLLYEQELKDAEREDLERIQSLADRLRYEKTDLPRPVLASAMKAYEERTTNALLQLERVISQMLEEEEAAIVAALLLDE